MVRLLFSATAPLKVVVAVFVRLSVPLLPAATEIGLVNGPASPPKRSKSHGTRGRQPPDGMRT